MITMKAKRKDAFHKHLLDLAEDHHEVINEVQELTSEHEPATGCFM